MTQPAENLIKLSQDCVNGLLAQLRADGTPMDPDSFSPRALRESLENVATTLDSLAASPGVVVRQHGR